MFDHPLLQNVMIGCVMVIATTFVHAGAMALALEALRTRRVQLWGSRSRASVVAVVVVVMFLASVGESAMWASTYWLADKFHSFEEALYFSTVTYTTLGYGDLVLKGDARLLSTFEAANGVIMFGWTTALIVAAVQQVYFPRDGDQEIELRRTRRRS